MSRKESSRKGTGEVSLLDNFTFQIVSESDVSRQDPNDVNKKSRKGPVLSNTQSYRLLNIFSIKMGLLKYYIIGS